MVELTLNVNGQSQEVCLFSGDIGRVRDQQQSLPGKWCARGPPKARPPTFW